MSKPEYITQYKGYKISITIYDDGSISSRTRNMDWGSVYPKTHPCKLGFYSGENVTAESVRSRIKKEIDAHEDKCLI